MAGVSDAELHLVGEIQGGFNFRGHSFFVTYELIAGTQWKHIEGADKGTSHIMQNSPIGEDVVWTLPIDIHYRLCSVQGWPKISLQVWVVDEFGRKDLAGYGMAYVPMPGGAGSTAGRASNNNAGVAGGVQTFTIETWKPTCSQGGFFKRAYTQMREMIMGGNPVLRDDSLVHNNDMRYKLHTVSGGTVKCNIAVLMRNAKLVGLQLGTSK